MIENDNDGDDYNIYGYKNDDDIDGVEISMIISHHQSHSISLLHSKAPTLIFYTLTS